jgi:hypothetical protein
MSSAASDVYKRQPWAIIDLLAWNAFEDREIVGL